MCGVCSETAYFDVRRPALTYRERAGKRVAMTQLFRCGHSMCASCFDEMMKPDPYAFSCPFCRDIGAYFTYFASQRTNPAHTLAQWIREYRDLLGLGLLKNCSHPFMILLRSIAQKALQAQRAKRKVRVRTEEVRALEKGRILRTAKKGLRPVCNLPRKQRLTVRKGRARKGRARKINDIERSRLLERRGQLVESRLRLKDRNHRRSRDKAKTFQRRLRGLERRLRGAR